MPRSVRFRLLLAFAASLSAGTLGAELRGQVPNPYEDAAVEEGRQLGIGSMRLEGPESVEVLSHQTFALEYAAGRAGIQPGGGVRVGLRHLSNWSVPQTKDPKAEGYMTVDAPGKQTVQTTVDLRNKYFVFKTYVDAPGTGKYLPLTDSPAIEIVAADPGETEATFEWRDPDFEAAQKCYHCVRIVQENGEEAISSPIWLNSLWWIAVDLASRTRYKGGLPLSAPPRSLSRGEFNGYG